MMLYVEDQATQPLLTNARIHMGFMADAAALNREILDRYLQLREQDFLRRSHCFHGRYENLYLAREQIPAIGHVLTQAACYARRLIAPADQQLRCGFWINDMGPGAVTTEHNHDENDEILSAVYYIQAPPDSGDLVIRESHSSTQITPQDGMFVFFAPAVTHSVSLNQSGQRRISIGMNFGPA